MRAALFHEFGGIDKIVVEDVETPKPAPNEVLIKVGACALNHLDVDFREGISRFPVDPGGVFGVARRKKTPRLAAQEEFPVVVGIDAGKDLHQPTVPENNSNHSIKSQPVTA